MPAEWEPHEATWLTWPKDSTTFPPDTLEEVEKTYLKMIEELSRGERVDLLVDDQETQDTISTRLKSTKDVFFHQIRTADVWVRDYGPIFVKNKQLAATKWIFNAWGNKYDDLKEDNHSGMKIAALVTKKIFEPHIVLEGGSIDVNGLGTSLTTRQCLLNKNRNPQLDQMEIQEALRDYLGITNVIWLDSGVAGDDTDGHVDDIARFVNPNTILCMTEADAEDENYDALKTNVELLRHAKDQDGHELKVVELQMPVRLDADDGRLPASYANFYIGNAAVLVPTFNSPNDDEALETIRRYFPGRRVVGIECSSLVYGFGGIHCVTQQQPSV